MNAAPLPPHGLLDALRDGDVERTAAIVALDLQQRIVMANPMALRLLGFASADGLLGRALSDFVPQRLRDGLAHGLQAWMAATAPGAAQRQILVGQRANGDEFPLELSLSRLAVAGSLAAGPMFSALLRDLSAGSDSDEPRRDDQLAMSDRLRSVLDLAPTAIWIADGDQIAFANRACAALFGASDHRLLLGRSIYSLLLPASHAAVRQCVAQALTTQQRPLPTVSERIARLDGSVRDVEIAMAAVPDHGRTTLQMVISDITERNRTHRAQERSRRELRQLAASLVEAREAERRRIALELHDELGQRLTALKLELSNLRPTHRPGSAAERLPVMLAMVDDTVAAVRRIATELRPAVLDDLGLNAAIEGLACETARHLGVALQLHLPTDDPPVDEATAIALYRMVQEALTNIARHARATEVQVSLQCDATSVTLVVQDNGQGFIGPPVGRRGSHGLVGLRERSHMLGGHIEVGNAPGGGARIRVRLPLVPKAPDSQPGGLDGATQPADLDDGAVRPPGANPADSAEAASAPHRLAALTHELQVHQIELELQNEALRRTQAELAAARDRFADLFEFAPVGYLTLDLAGRITEINVTGAAMLGEPRRPLSGRSFSRFVAADDRSRWQQQLHAAQQADEPQRFELALQARHGERRRAQLDCQRVLPTDAAPLLRVTLTDVTQRHTAEMDRRITANVVAARESERRRVSRELHEELGQRLSTLKMDLSSLRQTHRADAPRITGMIDSLDEAVATVRRIAGELRPLMLDDLGLNAAMDWLARDSAHRLGLAVTLQLDEADPALDEQSTIALYRLVQATLVHLAHQAQASRVSLALRQRPGELLLTVQDDGTGWPAPVRAGSDDCAGLREQAHLLGGRLELSPQPGGGQRLRFHIPMPHLPHSVAPSPPTPLP